MSTLLPWRKVNSRPTGDYRIFHIRTDRKVSPRTGAEHDFFVIESAHWVNVIAVTPDDCLVMVEQYRHGSNTIELEVPGGMMDPQDASPVAAGARELREETGYAGEHGRVLGQVFPNPAIQSNTCFTVLFEDCTLKHPLQWDHGEELETRLIPVAEIPGMLARGEIRHSLVFVALTHFNLLRRGAGK